MNLKSKTFNLQLKGDHLRYGFVGITTDGESVYSPVNAITFEVPKGKTLAHLYLIVMGAPEKHDMIPMPTETNPEPKIDIHQIPYEFQISTKR